MYPTLFWLHFSLSGHFFSWNFWKCAPRLHGKHNSEYSHKADLIKNLAFWTSKRPKSSPFWWRCSALSLCCSPPSLFIPPMPPKLNLKKPRTRVYYCYRWLAWTTWTMYPTSFWWHLHVCDTMLVTFWRIRHDFNRIFYILATCFYYFSENVLPARTGSTIRDDGIKHFWSKIALFRRAQPPQPGSAGAAAGSYFEPWPSNNNGKTNGFSTFSLFGPIKPPYIAIILAI